MAQFAKLRTFTLVFAGTTLLAALISGCGADRLSSTSEEVRETVAAVAPATQPEEVTVRGTLAAGESTLVAVAGSKVSFLVESPDVGLVEVGISVTVDPGFPLADHAEFTLTTADGREFSTTPGQAPSRDASFTINASDLGSEDFIIQWRRDGQVLAIWTSN